MVTLNTTFAATGTLTSSEGESQRQNLKALSNQVEAAAVAKGATVNRTYGGAIPAIALSVTPAALDALTSSPDVAKIDPDIMFAPSDNTTVPLIGAADAQDRGFHGYSGADGRAAGVHIMDTGVEYGHSAFGGRVIAAWCFSSGNDCPNGTSSQYGGNAGIPCTYAAGECSHGTHVAGIAAGAGSTAPGVSDQTSISSTQVFHDETTTDACDPGPAPCARSNFSDITAALVNADDARGFGYTAINISIGGGDYTSNCDADFSAMKSAIDNLRSHNIATVISSGNDSYSNAVSAPGCISTAITVGATNNSDQVANFSNSSAQVDFFAPGVDVYAPVPGNTYGTKSGTSMAAPHVTGSIAMMKAANTGLTVAQEESLLGSSGPLITDSAASPVISRHRINVLQAMGQETVTLTNDGLRDLRNPIPYDHRFATTSTNGYWSAVAIRPPAASDYDLAVYDNSDLSGLLGSSGLGVGGIDFVAQDNNSGRRAFPDSTYPVVNRYGSSGGGRYQIEYANDVAVISDSSYPISMGSSEIIEIRDSSQTAGVPTYYRVVPSNSGQDPELFLMESVAGNAATYFRGRSSAVASASAGGAGAAEGFSFTSSATQYEGLVLINKSGSGSYTLYRDTSAPTSSAVSINNGDANTTGQNVDLALSATDGQTGVMDMRVSVDGTLDSEAFEPYATSKSVTLPAGVGTKTVIVQFRNNAGFAAAPASDTIELVALPGAPTVTNTTPSAGAATVAFTAPATDGGSPITSYSVNCASTNGGVAGNKTGSASPLQVTGLTAGKGYHCRVRATNAVGSGAYSPFGATVTLPAPAAPPAPTVTNTTPSAGAATVAFTANGTGGSPITSYSVNCVSTNGGVAGNKTGSASPLQVTGLTAGKVYHCRVRATNAVGSGAYSPFGATVTLPAPVAPPAPTVTNTTPSAGAATVAFTANGTGGSPITSYSVNCVSTNGGVAGNKTGSASPLQVTGLTAGKGYHCRVRATNAVGSGAYSPFGATVTLPAPVAPPAPTVTNTTPSAGAATVAFTANGTGGSPITSYSVNCVSTNGGVAGNKTGSASPLQVTGLTAGKGYHCRVRATNAVGSGAYSPFGATVTLPAPVAPPAPTVTLPAPAAPPAPTATNSTPSAGAATVAYSPFGATVTVS